MLPTPRDEGPCQTRGEERRQQSPEGCGPMPRGAQAGGPSPGAPAGSAACDPRIPDFSLRGRRRARPAAPAAAVLSLMGQPRGAGAPSRTPVPVPRGCADSWGASVDGEGAAPSWGGGRGGTPSSRVFLCISGGSSLDGWAVPARARGDRLRAGREAGGRGKGGLPSTGLRERVGSRRGGLRGHLGSDLSRLWGPLPGDSVTSQAS